MSFKCVWLACVLAVLLQLLQLLPVANTQGEQQSPRQVASVPFRDWAKQPHASGAVATALALAARSEAPSWQVAQGAGAQYTTRRVSHTHGNAGWQRASVPPHPFALPAPHVCARLLLNWCCAAHSKGRRRRMRAQCASSMLVSPGTVTSPSGGTSGTSSTNCPASCSHAAATVSLVAQPAFMCSGGRGQQSGGRVPTCQPRCRPSALSSMVSLKCATMETRSTLSLPSLPRSGVCLCLWCACSPRG